MTKWQQAVLNLLNIPVGQPKIFKPAPTTRICTACKKEKDIFMFYTKATRCKPCQLLYVAQWKRDKGGRAGGAQGDKSWR